MTVISMSRKPPQTETRKRRTHVQTLLFAAWHVSCTVSLSGCLYLGPPWIPDENDNLEKWDVSPDSDLITRTGNNSLIVEINAPEGEAVEIRWLINDYRVQESDAIRTLPLQFFDDRAIHSQYLDMGELDEQLIDEDEIRVKAKLLYGAFVPIHAWTVDLDDSEVGS